MNKLDDRESSAVTGWVGEASIALACGMPDEGLAEAACAPGHGRLHRLSLGRSPTAIRPTNCQPFGRRISWNSG